MASAMWAARLCPRRPGHVSSVILRRAPAPGPDQKQEGRMDLSQVTSLGSLALTWATDILPRLVTALIILVVGYYVASWAARGARSLMTRARHSDMTMVPVVGAVVRYCHPDHRRRGGARPARRADHIGAGRARRRGPGHRPRLAGDAGQYRRRHHAPVAEAVPRRRLYRDLRASPAPSRRSTCSIRG